MTQFERSRPTVTPIGRVALPCVIILSQNFLSPDLFPPLVVLAGFLVWLTSYGRIRRSYLRLVWPLLAVLLIGIAGTSGHKPYDILRDIAFALVPLALIYIGYWLADDERMWPLVLKVMMLCGFVMAVIHLSRFVFNPELLTADLEEIRREAGGSGAPVTFSLVVGLFQYRLGLRGLLPKLLPRAIFIAVLSASFVLSYSRTEIAVAIVLALSLWGALSRINLRLALAAVGLLAGSLAIIVTTPEGETGTLRSKLARSATEVAVSNYSDMADINANWRGFETYRALQSFAYGGVVQQVFGQGFGALVDLGLYMPLGGTELRYIPITHNGYAYVLIKAGLLGLLFYGFFYAHVIRYAVRHGIPQNREQEFLSRLLLGCVWGLIVVMYVMGGMAETAEPALVLLLGYLVRRIGQFHVEKIAADV